LLHMDVKLMGKSEAENVQEYGIEKDVPAYGAVSNMDMEKTA